MIQLLHKPQIWFSVSLPEELREKETDKKKGSLLREHQLEAVTKSAQQDELERRRRLEQQSKQDFPVPLLPEYSTGDVTKHVSSSTGISEDDSKTNVLASASTERRHKTDVIDLSSGEDDTIVHVSSESPIEEEDSEPCGAHVIDASQWPDSRGRVLVNLNHPDVETDIFLSPQLARAVKPHQIGGIRFLYDNLVESVERFGSTGGFGCILAHSMGLGKTLQVIAFIDVLFRHTQAHTVLAIVPVNTLQNWLAEFNMWVPPPEALPRDSDPGLVTPRAFKVHILNDEHKNTAIRAKVVEDWAQDGGVLLMGYEMYRLLSTKKSFVAGRKKKSKKTTGPVVINLDEEDRQQELLKGIEQALARPGPDLVICDEGHRIKNCHASTSQALKNIQTLRRVVLTGYPLQNNLIEYWCMVDFVRPDFLGTRQEFSNMFERPILNGQCVDSTPQDDQLMRYRTHVLHSLLEGFVQRRGHDILKDQLPSKEEHVILVRLSPLQRALYTEFMNRFREAGNSGWLSLNPLKAFAVCCKIWNHPDVLYEALQKENLATDQDLDLDDITTTGPSQCTTASNQKSKPLENPNPIGGLSLNQLQERANQVITYEWAKEILYDYKPGILENSAKMVLLFHLIEESVRKGDKILVFSQSLFTLTVIEDFLAKRPVPPSPNTSSRDRPNQNWVRNHNYYTGLLCGAPEFPTGWKYGGLRERETYKPVQRSGQHLSVGLPAVHQGWLPGCVNLIGANRVVVFDASWNPCHDAQAVCRVYRYGQRKQCHIYRLVCGLHAGEEDLRPPDLQAGHKGGESLLHFVEEEPDPSQVHLRPEDSMESVLRKALHLYPRQITKQPFPHESLLIDRRELRLSKAEKKAAKKGYEEEKRASVPYTRPSYAHYYPASDQSLTNIPAFSQRNWRPPPRTEEKSVASVRPVQSTPVPMTPRQASAGSAPGNDSSESSLGEFPVKCLQKAGVFVQKIVTTTDIVIPGTNSSTDVQARITAGESIHIIRGTKGTYIRSSDGRIFAIRAAGKPKPEEESTAPPKDSQALPQEMSTDGSNGKQQTPSKTVPRPLSPDSPEIISELQRYTGAAPPAAQPESPPTNLPCTKLLQTNGKTHHHDASVTNVIQPNMDTIDLRQGVKRQACTPSLEELPSKQPHTDKHSSAPLASPGFSFPFNGGYSLPPLDLFSLGGTGTASSSCPTTNTATSVSSSSSSSASVKGAGSVPGAMPPFMLSPSMVGMAGMLPAGFPLSYSPSLASLYTGSMLPGGLPGPAATPGPAGASFLSQFPSTAASSSSSSSPSSFSPSGEGHRGTVLVDGRNVSSASSSDDDDDDVIEVRGQ
ncbi:hypothetical protein KUCAC02_012406 [Chaenocephalus aceratus]|uniref:Uncharacterized protein n=1 Tax=Chaenocephalus aceratus TaxID=36190 RepID=A0ACB9XAH3_CHAAC|nr:hypothetical protein KUCAC02_012406 [Chaenocephalus aceratus]